MGHMDIDNEFYNALPDINTSLNVKQTMLRAAHAAIHGLMDDYGCTGDGCTVSIKFVRFMKDGEPKLQMSVGLSFESEEFLLAKALERRVHAILQENHNEIL